tara:strand:+ start:695 stop:1939 length:1245 start_codon:yes stop_codon:yes gene_type:complete
MAHIAGHSQLGANPVDDGTDDPQTFTYDLFTLKRNNIGDTLGDRKLQDVYGISADEGGVPSFNFVNAIVSGQRTYTDTSASDREMMEQYIEDYKNLNGKESGMIDPSVIMREIGSTVAPIAMSIGTNIATGGKFMEGLPFVDSGLSLDADLTSFSPAAVKGLTGTQVDALNKMPSLTGNNTLSTTDAMTALKVETPAEVSELGGLVGRDLSGGGFLGGPKGTFLKNLDITDPAGLQNYKGAFGGAVGNFGIQLLMGQDPVKAAKSAGAGAIGKVIGTAIGGPIGGFIGGALGSIVGGRVICNELYNQGLITKRQLLNDYKFTKDYLTPAHVNGYHLWALWMVKQMRKGKYVNFWKHVVLRRSNEIAYIYGERDKPDYLGKVYRKILEPTCWLLGKFCKVTDWSVLYNKKEIQHG